MYNEKLLEKIASLPEELKHEVADFVDFLLNKTKEELPVKQRQFGYAKGMFVMKPDFDEPLEDFKDYM